MIRMDRQTFVSPETREGRRWIPTTLKQLPRGDAEQHAKVYRPDRPRRTGRIGLASGEPMAA
jgi:hypothetical protein